MNYLKQKIFLDLAGLLISILPSLISTYFVFLFIKYFNFNFISLCLGIILFNIIFLVTIFIIRKTIPKVKAGAFEMNLNQNFIAWFLNLSLTRSVKIFPIKNLIYSSMILRFFYFKAMGANIHFNTSFAIDSDISDFTLITINEGCIISDQVKINAHLINKNKIFLSPVTIEKNCFIGEKSQIGARVKIFEGAFVKPDSNLNNTKIRPE